MSQVLVLDVGYQPVQKVQWETAIVWVLDRVVEVIDENPDRYIRTVSWSVKMPSVVRLLKPIARKKAIKFSRHNVYLRDKGRCQYCGQRVSRDRFTYDHVVPRSQGGRTEWANVCCACVSCNQRKANRTPEQARMKLLSAPARPKSLPDVRAVMHYTSDMPSTWKQWLASTMYWEGELENDNN